MISLPTRLDEEGGFALIAALWLLVILSAIGLEITLHSRSSRLAVANAAEAAVARAASEGGLEGVHARLAGALTGANRLVDSVPDPWGVFVAPESGTRFTHDVIGDSIRVGAVTVSTRLADAGSSLNLNGATTDELRQFFIALRTDAGLADELAQSIADWRDADSLPRPHGAEQATYLKEAATVLPSNRPFTRVADLRYVRHMRPEILARAAGMLAVRGTGRINLNRAPRPVILALPGMSEAAVAVLERQRQTGHPLRRLRDLPQQLSEGPRSLLQQAMPQLEPRVVFETDEILATITGQVDGSPMVVKTEGLFVRGGETAFLVWKDSP